MTTNILFIGDIVGDPGLDIVRMWLPSLQKKYRTDLIIANGENAADGKAVRNGKPKFFLSLA